MKNVRCDLSTPEGLTKALIKGVEDANTLEEILELANATEQDFRDMSSSDREKVISILKVHAKKGLEELIKEDIINGARELASDLEADVSNEEIEEMVSKITNNRLEEIVDKIIEEGLESSIVDGAKPIIISENDDAILLVPGFLPEVKEIADILSQVREDFGNGLQAIGVQDELIILEYLNSKDIVFCIEEEFSKGLKLEEYAKAIFKELEKYVKVSKVFNFIEENFEKLVKSV